MNTNRFQFHHKRCEGVRVSLTQVVIRIFYELWMQNRFSNTSIDEKSNDAFHYFSIIVVFLFNNKFVSLLLGRYLHVLHHASFCSQTYELFPIFSRHSSLQTLFLKQLFIFIPQPLFCIYFCLAHYRQFNICGQFKTTGLNIGQTRFQWPFLSRQKVCRTECGDGLIKIQSRLQRRNFFEFKIYMSKTKRL